MLEPHAPRPVYEPGASETFDLDDALVFVIRMAKWQIEEIQMQPSNGRETATARARDARTLNELFRTLERLKALQHAATGDKRKTKVRDEAERKDALVRRLNQLLEPRAAGAVSGRTQRG